VSRDKCLHNFGEAELIFSLFFFNFFNITPLTWAFELTSSNYCLLRFLLLSLEFGDLLFLHRFLLLLLLFLFFSPRFFPNKFSETDDPIFTKLHRKVEPPSQEVHSSLGIFKMAANIKIKKIVKNSTMKRFQWKRDIYRK
jgi:hypothetical protein